MLSEENFKNKFLQHPITFLTEENLDKLETHCRKAVKIEKGIEHKVVSELLDRYYQYQKELQDKNSKLTELQEENKEKDKIINSMAKYIAKEDKTEKFCNYKTVCDQNCEECVVQHFKDKVTEK